MAEQDFSGEVGDECSMRREGEYWTLTYHGSVCRLRDCVGLRQIAFLVQHPDQRIPATTLQSIGYRERADESPLRAANSANQARINVTRAMRAALRRIATHHTSLHDHLQRTLRTGGHCCYIPDPRLDLRWLVTLESG